MPNPSFYSSRLPLLCLLLLPAALGGCVAAVPLAAQLLSAPGVTQAAGAQPCPAAPPAGTAVTAGKTVECDSSMITTALRGAGQSMQRAASSVTGQR